MKREFAETGDIEKHFTKLGAALDRFLNFEQSDPQNRKAEWMNELKTQLPQTGTGIDKVLETINKVLLNNASPVPKPGFTSFITTGATTSSVLASTASGIASPQRYLGTAFNLLEEVSLDWLAELCGVAGLKGVYSSGGSVANLIALGGARQSAYEKLGVDPAACGIDRPGRIYASEECHHTIQRSAGVLGLGRRAVISVPCDKLGRMKPDSLLALLEKDRGHCNVAIVANAGTTNRGVIDPLFDIGQIAKETDIWFHIDGAYGLPGVLDTRLSELYKGIELADSLIVDPHKWLGASVGIAATLVKDRSFLLRAFTQEPADYLEGSAIDKDALNVSEQKEESIGEQIEHALDDFGIPYFDYGVELSAPCRGVVMWAMLKEIGVEGMRARVVRHNDMARYVEHFANEHPLLEVLNPASLSICCFRFVNPEIQDLDKFNQKLHRELVRENTNMPSTTRIEGKLAIRPCFVGARTEMAQAEALMQDVIRIGTKMLNQ